jgi:hypothetical protein
VGNKPKQTVSGNAKWPSMHENHPQLEFVVASIAPSANSFTQNHPYIEVKSSSLKLPTDEKGKKPMKESSSSETSKPASVHSKAKCKGVTRRR